MKVLILIFAFFQVFASTPTQGQDVGRADRLTRVRTALLLNANALYHLQRDDGRWQGVLEADATADVIPIFLKNKLGLSHPSLRQETLDRVFAMQDPKTSCWSAYPGGPASADVTGLVLYGLKEAGIPETNPRVAKAWEWHRKNGGLKSLGILNQMIANFADLTPLGSIPPLSPKFFSIPKSASLNIFNVGFGRAGLIPYAVWSYYRRARLGLVEHPSRLAVERIRSAGASFGAPMAAPLKFPNLIPDFLKQKKNIATQENFDHSLLHDLLSYGQGILPMSEDFWAQEGLGWILSRQQADGTWAGALQITYFCMLTLHEAQLMGVGDFRAQIENAWRGLMSWRAKIPEGQMIQQVTMGPIMDTARVLSALMTAPKEFNLVIPSNAGRAVDFLLRKQIFKPGDWSYLSPDLKAGAWAFEEFNDFYPDADDTAMVLEALAGTDTRNFPRAQAQINRGMGWLVGLQNKDGGFPAWDRGTSSLFRLATELRVGNIPEVHDSSQNDITSRALRALSAIRESTPNRYYDAYLSKPIARACDFLMKHRMKIADASLPLWRGEWMVDYLYGTSEAMSALLLSRCLNAKDLSREALWLASKQDLSGGWGESQGSYSQKNYVKAPPTITQTEFVLNALIEYEKSRGGDGTIPSVMPSIDRAMDWLLHEFENSAAPYERGFTGVFALNTWYARYVMLPQYEGVRVFGNYLSLMKNR